MIFSGIYEIIDHKGRTYIGSSKDIHARWAQHRRELEAGTHHSIKLQRGWKKYGADCFQFKILQYVQDDSDLLKCEQFFIDTCLPFYNIASVAGRVEWSYEKREEKREAREIRDAKKEVDDLREAELVKNMCSILLDAIRVSCLTDPSRMPMKIAMKYYTLYRRAELQMDPFNVLDENLYYPLWCWNEVKAIKGWNGLWIDSKMILENAKMAKIEPSYSTKIPVPSHVNWSYLREAFLQEAVSIEINGGSGILTAPRATYILNTVANGSNIVLAVQSLRLPKSTIQRWRRLEVAGKETYVKFFELLKNAINMKKITY